MLPKIFPHRDDGSCLAIQEFMMTLAVAVPVAAHRFYSNIASRSLPNVEAVYLRDRTKIV